MASQRVVGIVGAVVVGVVALVIALSSGGDDGDRDSGAAGTTATQTEPATTGETATEEAAPAPPPAPPPVPRVRIRDGQPVGGVERIEVKKGETIRFDVTTSDTSGHVHFHGYDILRDLAPGTPARFRVKAKLEGIFEVELEDTRTKIAEVRVEP